MYRLSEFGTKGGGSCSVGAAAGVGTGWGSITAISNWPARLAEQLKDVSFLQQKRLLFPLSSYERLGRKWLWEQ